MLIIEEFENQLQKDLRDDNINGSMSAAIVKNNSILWTGAFGTANREKGNPANVNTIYRVGSIAKSFTAFLMMQLVQAEIIRLDDPVEIYFPDVCGLDGYSDTAKVTFRQLASHTSGLSREPKLEKADSGPIDEWEDKVLQSIPKTSFESRPGERFEYSNIGYAILGVALSRAAQAPFIQLVAEKILRPLDMNDSFFVVPEHKIGDLALGIAGGPFGDDEPDGQAPQKEHLGRGYKVPNGGIYSTAVDLAKFLICNLGYMPILEKQYLDLLHTRQTSEAGYRTYGLGFELYQDRVLSIAGHSGGVSGYSSDFEFERNYRYGVILLRNYNWGVTSWDLVPKILLRKLINFEKDLGNEDQTASLHLIV